MAGECGKARSAPASTRRCTGAGFIFPIAEYAHAGGRCSVTGGYVYRGTQSDPARRHLLYGDFCTGEIFQYRRASEPLLDTGLNISSFGEDEAGELYVVGLGGTIYRIIRDDVCTFAVSPTSHSVPATGVQGAIAAVTAPAGCSWTAAVVGNASWLAITSGGTGNGNGNVVFDVASNVGSAASRTATMTIAGQTVTVTQAGCAPTISPASRSVPVAGVASAATSVSAPADCAWTAASNAPWITITANPSGSGNRQVAFRWTRTSTARAFAWARSRSRAGPLP